MVNAIGPFQETVLLGRPRTEYARPRMAIEGAYMTITERNPPPWADALLRSLLRPRDRESISGDLLEEYREVRRPALGARSADAWYIKHVLSVFWRLLWPFAIASIALHELTRLVGLPHPALFQAPGVSAQDATLCLLAGYFASQRTALIRTGAIMAGAINALVVTMVFVSLAINTPALVLLLFHSPGYVFFPSVYLLIGLGFGIGVGSVGGIVGRWLPLTTRGPARMS